MSDHASDNSISTHPFWMAALSNDVAAARRLLERNPGLVSRDFRPEEDRDPFADGFPLVKSARSGHLEMVKLLLEHGADVNAKSPHEDQREFATPLGYAVERKDYAMAHLLLDHGSSVDGYFYCTVSTFDSVFAAAREDGAAEELVRKGLEKYLGEVDVAPVGVDAPDSVKLYDRFLTLGGQPSMESIVRAGYNDIVEELLLTAPEAPGTPHDHPNGTILDTICNAASWCGYPEPMAIAMRICDQLYTPGQATRAIGRALVSHNRDGTVDDYYRLIESQLNYLKNEDALESVIAEGSLLPHYELAKDYLWPGWSGREPSPSTVESMIGLSELFVRYGFDDFKRPHPESGLTPLAKALQRKDHPGLDAYATYLRERGGQLPE